MADPVKIIKAALAAAGAVTALVSDRISPNPRAQGEPLPAVSMRVVSTSPNTHLQGDGNLDEVRIQVDCYGATYSSVAVLADAVRAAISAVDRVLVNELSDFDPTTEAHVVSQDYLLWIDPTA